MISGSVECLYHQGGGENGSGNARLVYMPVGNRCNEPAAICTPSCQDSGATEESSLNST